MLGHGGSSAGSYLADPTSPIPSHCAVIILFQSVPVHQLSSLALQELTNVYHVYNWLCGCQWHAMARVIGPWVTRVHPFLSSMHSLSRTTSNKSVPSANSGIECTELQNILLTLFSRFHLNPWSAEFLKNYWSLYLKTLMVGHGGSSASFYLADPTSPIPSYCASIVATSTLRVNLICKPSLLILIPLNNPYDVEWWLLMLSPFKILHRQTISWIRH